MTDQRDGAVPSKFRRTHEVGGFLRAPPKMREKLRATGAEPLYRSLG